MPRSSPEASKRRQFLPGVSAKNGRQSPGVLTARTKLWPYVISMSLERWIVVGTDFSEGARDALECARRLAECLGARVALVHAYEEAPGAQPQDDPIPSLLGRLAQEILLSRACGPEVQVEPLVRRGRPWEKILNVATEYGAELTVLGFAGQSGEMRGLLVGSVVSRVLALSTRSVVVARPRLVASPDA
jgi:nucleotide-binding universal stress UspA family protein